MDQTAPQNARDPASGTPPAGPPDASDGQPARKNRGRSRPRQGNQNSNRSKKPSPKGQSQNPRAAVIDLGTNNCRLLIAEKMPRAPGNRRPAAFKVVDSFSRIVRLGEGLGQSGELSEAAIERTVAALKICAKKIGQSSAFDVRAVATQACRQASNGEAFLKRVEEETGIKLKTISPMEEAQLGVSSTLPLLRKRWPMAVIFDVGGGSTEVSILKFVEGRGFQIQDALSVPMGVVNMAEAHVGREDDVSRETYDLMLGKVRQAFLPFATRNNLHEHQRNGQIQTVGMSGTVTTVKALDLGLETYRRNAVDKTLFTMSQLPGIRDGLIQGGHAGLMANGCIGKDRSDLVLPGVAILEGLAEAFAFTRLLVLDRGLREGLLHDVFKPKRRRRRTKNKGKPSS